MSDLISTGVPSIGDMRAHLQLLLDNKEKQLQQVGTLGQRILSQQVQLDERVRHLHDLDAELGDNQDLDSEIRERYRELMEMVKTWDTDNGQLTQSFDPKVRSYPCPFFDPGEGSAYLPLARHKRYSITPVIKNHRPPTRFRAVQSWPFSCSPISPCQERCPSCG